jgi:D-lactate dehydrogenase (cytochrome)
MPDCLISPLDDRFRDYLADESRHLGEAETISFPESETDVQELVKELNRQGSAVTVQGGRTGIAGGAVPEGGHVMNLSRMNRVVGFSRYPDKEAAGGNVNPAALLHVEPGLTLLELQSEIARLKSEEVFSALPPLFWPPDPTETSATIGGIAACGSQGPTAGYYGKTGNFVEQIRVVDARGDVREICRGVESVSFNGVNADLVDIYLGSEGRSGIITQITLRLLPKPSALWGIAFFFSSVYESSAFAEALQNFTGCPDGAGIAAGEYIDERSLQVLEEFKTVLPDIRDLPRIPREAIALIYVELHGSSEDAVEVIAEQLLETAASNGSDPDKAWALSGESEVRKIRAFRHAVPESINLKFDQLQKKALKNSDLEIFKLGTDMTIPGISFSALLERYRDDLTRKKLDGAVFGHIGDNHLHVNILPSDPAEFAAGQKLIDSWGAFAAAHGGTVVSEHGTGTLRKKLFQDHANQELLAELRRIKTIYDPEGFWNPSLTL